MNTDSFPTVNPLIPPLADNDYLIPLIAEMTGVDVCNVTERLIQEHLHCPHSVAEAFYAKKLTPYVWSDDLLTFYEETDSFIYGIVAWNRSQVKCVMRQWMLDFLRSHDVPYGRVLICGDGIGIDSFFFAQAGYDVVFYEVSRLGQKMGKRLFDDYGLRVQIADSLETLGAGSFDAVLSLDVLEHVPSPPDNVSELSRYLKQGGLFVVSAPFYAVHPKWPTHLKCNRKYSGRTNWISKAGDLNLVGGRMLANPLVFQKRFEDGKSTFALSWLSRCSLGFGNILLRLSATFPNPILHIVLTMHRYDKQLRRLRPVK
ncbi:MAG: class I SAM-dependent methyltransferase [Planctomycetaceae bacterium]|jgi:SAM-dependent methyltransferase|nr:class I SAM-dependent methyltransferase [Planctomycetaceae bacterium]